MAGRTAGEREALAKQNIALMAVFERAGYAQIAPDIIQPADIFLERSGEDIRARTFVFNDPEGNEQCLRPDLTVPACRFHLSHATDASKEARYSYLGPAFRFPNEKLSPQEFNQAGLEWFGNASVASEARLLKLAISALEAAGASNLKVTLGDMGLFASLLEDTPMPSRWRRRLQHQFWRPNAFHALLRKLSKQHQSSSIATLDEQAFHHQGLRNFEDVTERLAEKRADQTEPPLPLAFVKNIESYLALQGGAEEMLEKLQAIQGGAGFNTAVKAYENRLTALEEQGLNPKRFTFNASFGREIEYYTGFVFQIDMGEINVAGGGRYDTMLQDLGATQAIPALGFAIHTERLQAVLS